MKNAQGANTLGNNDERHAPSSKNDTPTPVPVVQSQNKQDAASKKVDFIRPNPNQEQTKRRKLSLTFAKTSFLFSFFIPIFLVVFYYTFIASDQYRVDAQFSVRGVTQSPLADLGIVALPGATSQGGDSYIVTDYILSSQLIYDLAEIQHVDLRSFYSSDNVDFFYRIDAGMPVEEFREYWKNRVKVGYNSTTGNTEMQIFAFSAGDAKLIADNILILSERLVNEISSKSRDQLLDSSREEVLRTQERLNDIRKRLLQFRDREQAFDPSQVAELQVGIVRELEAQLSSLETRKRTISGSIQSDSPAVRVLDSQIEALQTQIEEERSKFGSGTNGVDQNTIPDDSEERNLSQVLDEYSELKLEQDFATTAFTSALSALEKADAQARQQQRYFATYIFPRAPEVSLYPKRIFNCLMAAFWFLCLWAILYFVGRSVRDHAI